MRKPAASSRNRKKGNNASSSSAAGVTNTSAGGALQKYKSKKDPCHNGQVPACEMLLDAVRDVFPELQPSQNRQRPSEKEKASSKSPKESSRKQAAAADQSSSTATALQPNEQTALAELLRWRILWLRESAMQQNHRHSATTVNGEQGDDQAAGSTANTTNKKKKKRKKKKKGGEEEEEPQAAAAPSENAPTKTENGSKEKNEKSSDNDGPSKEESSPQPQQKEQGNGEKKKEKSSNNSVPSKEESAPQQEQLPPKPPQDESPAPGLDQIPFEDWTPQSESNPSPKTLAEATVVDPLELEFLTMPGYSPETTGDMTQGDTTESETTSSRKLFYEWLDQAFLSAPSSDNGNNGSAVNGPYAQQREKDWNSFLEFCQQRALGQEKGKAIPLADVLELVRSISCRACREEALDVIRKWVELALHASSDSPHRIVMKPSYLEPKKGPAVDIDADAAFDYVALEEGHHLPLNQDDSDDDNGDDEAGASNNNLSFLIMEESKTKRSTETDASRGDGDLDHKASRLQLLPAALNAENFDTFLRDWLPAGIDESSLVDMSIDTDQEKPAEDKERVGGSDSDPVQVSQEFLQRSKSEVTEQVEGYFQDDFLGATGKTMEENLVNEVENVRHALAPRQNIHLSAFKVLNNCDDMCDKYIQAQLLGQLVHAEESFLHEAQADLEMKTWSRFLEVLTEIFGATEAFYNGIEENIVDQNGAIEPIFVNAGLRTLFGDLVERKTRSATDLGTEMKTSLRTKSVMKERFTRAMWASEHFRESDAFFDLEHVFTKLLDHLLDWMNVIHERRMSHIRREQRTARELVLDSIESVLPDLEKAYEETEAQFSPEQQQHFRSLLFTMKLRRGAPLNSQLQLEENLKVFNLTKSFILMWRHVRFMKQRMMQSSVPPLPLPLKQFMMESHDPTDMGALQGGRSLCGHGWGGKRRVRCIVAGITYNWLSSMCSEWKSESAAEELLKGFELEVAAPTNVGPSKPSKKAKKKKKKAAASQSDAKPTSEDDLKRNGAQESAKTEPTETAAKEVVDESKLLVDPPKETETSKPSKAPKNKDRKAQNGAKETSDAKKIEEDNAEAVVSTKSKGKKTKPKALAKPQEHGTTLDTKKAVDSPVAVSEAQTQVNIGYYESFVMVEDNGEEISAQDFLIARFNDLMKSAANGDAAIISVA